MDIHGQVDFHNKFDIILKSAETGEIKQTATAYNVVLNNYYDKIKSADRWTDVISICVGTGTGTPAVTDTDLFTFLALGQASRGAIKTVQNHKKYSTTITTTFTETQAIGLITEVGISQGSYYYNRYVCTHAMLQDEHGQPTAINKTNTDVLIITATMYVEVTLPSWIKPFPLRTDGRFYLCTNFDDASSVSFSAAPHLIRRLFMDYSIEYGYYGNGGYWSFGLCKNCGPSWQFSSDNKLDPGIYSSSYNSGVRMTCNTVLSSSWSTTQTYQFKSLAINTVGLINFGDPNIYPYTDVERTQTADGNQTGFNFGIPELDDYVEVYIDGVLQNSSTYTWNKKDYNCFQALESCDGEYMTELGTWSGGSYTTFGPYWRYGENSGSSTRPTLKSDFGRVLTFRRSYTTGTNGTVSIDYSVDGTNWSTLTYNGGKHDIDPPIQARYLRNNWAFTGYEAYWGGIGQGTDQLVFNNAPPANSVVKIKSKSPYPMKDSDWILQSMTFDLYLDKAT